MNGDRVFNGTVMRSYCHITRTGITVMRLGHNYETGEEFLLPNEVIKENATLICVPGGFIDVDCIKNNFDLVANVLQSNVLGTSPKCCGDYYVDEYSLVPYYSQHREKTNVYQLKNERNNN